MSLPKTTKIKLIIQRCLSYIAFPALYSLYWLILFKWKKYKIANIKKLRKQFQAIMRNNINNPLLICPNHFTYIDSIILILVFGSLLDYMCNFRSFAWNFPKTTHVRKNFGFLLLGYLSKCIFIELEHQQKQLINPTEIAKYLLGKQDFIMIFPEGHRSTTGKIDRENFAYGVGKIIKDLPNIKVLCVYLRGHTQAAASKYPNKGDNFYCKLKLLEQQDLMPINDLNKGSISDLRLTRKIAKNVINSLVDLEEEFFSYEK